MRNEIKELSIQVDTLDNKIATLRTMLSPVTSTCVTATAFLVSMKKEEVDTRSEVSKSISLLCERIKTLTCFVDDISKGLDLGEV